MKNTRGFTLIELLVVIGVLATLASATALILNPAQLLKQARDSSRVVDLKSLNKYLDLYNANVGSPTGDPAVLYISLPDNGVDENGVNGADDCDELPLPTLPSGWRYRCVTQNNLRSVTGSGWMPVNFTLNPAGSPAKLPIDPVNSASTGQYYTYAVGSWALTAKMESIAYNASGNKNVVTSDGGAGDARYEIGTDLTLTPAEIVGNDGGSETVPGAPTAVSGTAGNGQVVVSWTAPATGGSAITSYTATSTPGSFTCTSNTGSPITPSCTVTGLTNGTSYTFTVTATNAAGTGTGSAASAAVIPRTTPGAPTSVNGTAGNGQVAVSWTAPASNGGSAITSYRATAAPGGLFCTSNTGSPITPSCTVTGLTNGTSYTFTVTATNAAGTGSASAASAAVIPRTTPGAPTSVNGTAGNGQVAVSWTAPASNGGATISGYTVSSSPASAGCTTAGTIGCTVTGLTNGTSYTFTVTATNAAGTGSASAASAAVIPRTTPGAPTSVNGTAGNGQVAVSWTAPASNGGATISGYTVSSSPASAGCTTAGTIGCTVTGLTNGTSYTFTVTATNAAGTGTGSAASAAVIPRTTPGAPTSVNGTAGNGQVAVSWTAPASNGGSAITSYRATAAPGGLFCTSNTGSPITPSCTVTGLTNGTSYTFTVTATNAAGTGSASAASAAVIPN